MNKNDYNKCGYCFTARCDKTIKELKLSEPSYLSWTSVKHSNKAYQECLENQHQYMMDFRNANRDIARLMFRQALLQK